MFEGSLDVLLPPGQHEDLGLFNTLQAFLVFSYPGHQNLSSDSQLALQISVREEMFEGSMMTP